MASTYKNIPPDPTEIEIVSNSAALTIEKVGSSFQLELDTSSIIVEEASSVVTTFRAGEVLSALQAVYFDPITARVWKADKTDLVKASVVGITKTAANLDANVEVIQYGLLSDASFLFQPAQLVFLSIQGLLTLIAPDSGFLTRLGRAINNNTILVLIDSPITL